MFRRFAAEGLQLRDQRGACRAFGVPALAGKGRHTALRRNSKQKTFKLRKTGNEGIQRILTKTDRQAGLILLLTEKLVIAATVTDRRYNNHDEHNQTDILTSGLTSLPPSQPRCAASGFGSL